jgi:hypothetical protein
VSLPTPHTVLRPTLIGGEWDQPCKPWDGRPADYGTRAVIAAQNRLGRALPWVNAEPVCGTPLCLTDAHLALHIPRRIAYPQWTCIYCGVPADTKDHLLPRTVTGDALRKFVAVVPSCRSCNSSIGDRIGHRVTQRRQAAHDHIRSSNARYLKLPAMWPEAALAELGPNLRRRIEAGLKLADIAQARLAWPEDPDYDRRAFEKSGFDDPVAMDLL